MSFEVTTERVLAHAAIAELRAAIGDANRIWMVGGGVRDALIDRDFIDIDLAVDGDAREVARRVHARLKGDIFSLSDRFGTWRVQPQDRGWRLDVTSLRGESIQRDLALRDFTVNAIAIPLAGGDPIDPHGGLEDLAARRLRVLGESAYVDDSLRPLRLPRFIATLGFEPDAGTAELTRKYAMTVTSAAPERIFAELRALVRANAAIEGLSAMAELGVMEAVLPELFVLRGVEQSVYHHLDAYEHTIEVLRQLIAIERDLSGAFGEIAEDIASELRRPLGDELTRGEALRFSALLHDIAKRETRTVFDDGRVGFPGHDQRGAEMTTALCARLHTSDRVARFLSGITREHLRLGFLLHQLPLSRRDIYWYMRACEPVEVEVGVLSVADRRATRGRKADEAIGAHELLARDLGREALEWRAGRTAEPIVRGDVLVAELGIGPGPEIGRLIELIAEAHFVGEIRTPGEAIAFARKNRVAGSAGD